VALRISLLVPVAQIHGQTQAEMNTAARSDFARADADLNKTYRAVLPKLPTAESKQKLREAQRAWVTSRDAEAAHVAKEAEGGSIAPTLRYEKMTELTKERIKELKAMLDRGSESGPTPAAASSAATLSPSTPEPASGQAQSVSETPSVLAADEEPEAAGEDSSAGLPEQYAKDYLVARSAISPDKKFAVIYPTLEAEQAADNANHPERIKDHIVTLQPFTILGELETKYPYFQNENHGGISAEWSDDRSVALLTLDGKWGPRDVFLLEFRDGKLARLTNILARAHGLLLPVYRKSKAEPYNDIFDFIFDDEDGPIFKLDGVDGVVIDGEATTDPKGISDHIWTAQLKAVWNIPQRKFTSQKITRTSKKQSD
jgi:uncharacterized protein YecT (DUF1311 family)